MVGLSYFICTFLVTRPFHGYQHLWPSDLDLEIWTNFKNFNLGNSSLTRRGRAVIFYMCIPCSKTFNAVPKFLTLWHWPWPRRLTCFIKKLTGTMTFESEGLLIVAIYIWLPPASYVVFLTTLVIATGVPSMARNSWVHTLMAYYDLFIATGVPGMAQKRHGIHECAHWWQLHSVELVWFNNAKGTSTHPIR